MLHLPVYSDAEPSPQKTLAAAERVSGFEEVVAGLTEKAGALRGAALSFLRQLL